MEKILAVTGATGKKSGGAFIEKLVANIDKVKSIYSGIRTLVRESSNTVLLEKLIPEVDVVRGNFDDKNYLNKALESVDTLVHIAGISFSPKLVDAAVKCQVRRLILVHTTGIYSKYKAAGEEYRKIDTYVYEQCKMNNIKLTVLRPTMIYGNLSDKNVCKFIKMVDKFPIMPVVNGARYQLQPVHYIDLADAYFQVLMHEKETVGHDFNLSGGEPIYLRDMLQVIGKNLGKKVSFISVPFPIAYAGAVCVYGISFGKVDYREKVQRLCEPRIFSHKEAKEAFGYNPMSFEQGVKNEVKEYKRKKK